MKIITSGLEKPIAKWAGFHLFEYDYLVLVNSSLQSVYYLSFKWTAPGGLLVECSPGVREVVRSIPGRVRPKTVKMVFDASLLIALGI